MRYSIITLFCFFLVNTVLQAQKVYVDENPSYTTKHKESTIEKIVYTPQSTIFFCRQSIPPTEYKSIAMYYGPKSKQADIMIDSSSFKILSLVRFRNLKKNGSLEKKELKYNAYIDPSRVDTIEITYELHFDRVSPDVKSVYLVNGERYKQNKKYFSFHIQMKANKDLIPIEKTKHNK